MKKTFVFLIVIVLQSICIAQSIPLNLNINGNNNYILYNNSSSFTIPATGGTANITPGANDVDFISNEFIELKEGFYSKSINSGACNINIKNTNVAFVELLHPGINVKKFDKYELGFVLPITINNRINNFLEAVKRRSILNESTAANEYNPFNPDNSFFNAQDANCVKPGTINYTTMFQNGTYINPYDPDHISVEGTFIAPSGKQTTVFGFYFKDFNRIDTNSDQIVDNWASAATDYNWRMRFAPDEVGTWRINFRLKVGDRIVSNFKHSFTCNSNALNYGFIQVANNKRNFKFNEGGYFFPLGDNIYDIPSIVKDQFSSSQLKSTSCGFQASYFKDVNDNSPFNSNLSYIDNPTNLSNIAPHIKFTPKQTNCETIFDNRIPINSEDFFTDYCSKYSSKKGNFVRLMMNPNSLGIEWEQLGIYETRQIEMKTLDKLIEIAKDNKVYLNLGLADFGSMFTNPNGDYYVGWTDANYPGVVLRYSNQWIYNPYRDNNITDPNYNCSNVD